jgi:hypothetical protein
VYRVHHHLVTGAGDMIFFGDADLTAFPTSDPNRVLADYLQESRSSAEPGITKGRRVRSFPLAPPTSNLAR